MVVTYRKVFISLTVKDEYMYTIQQLPKNSVIETVEWLKKNGFSDLFVKRFHDIANEKKAMGVITQLSIVEAFKQVRIECPTVGATPPEVYWAAAPKILSSIAPLSIDDAVIVLRDNFGLDEAFIKKFKDEALAIKNFALVKDTAFGTRMAIEEAFKRVTNQVPNEGITPTVLQKFAFKHPTTAKALKYVMLLALIFLIMRSIFHFLF